MDAVLNKIGKTTVLVLPSRILKTVGIEAGQQLTLQITADGKIVLTPTRKLNLATMIAQCDLKAPPPADLVAWNMSRPVGRELL